MEQQPHTNAPPETKKPFSLAQFSLYGQTEAMKEKMLNDVFVLKALALLGQITVFYAAFNTGKTLLTLYLLCRAIDSGEIKGQDVSYINADDTYAGLVTKNTIAEEYGFHMIAPDQNGFKPEAVQKHMERLIEDDTASGTIIILDTVKKFTDTMDKKAGTAFMKRVREFVQVGGTVIMLGHTNKHKNANGKSVYGGTNDIPSDADCVYTIEKIEDNSHNTQQVLFENIKNRGNVARTKVFSYSLKSENYFELFNSVTECDDQNTEQLTSRIQKNKQREKDKINIEAITETIQQGIHLKTELIKSAASNYGISKPKLNKTLDDYLNELWTMTIGEKNAKSYHLITKTTAIAYAMKKSKH